jgi:hypothetical protein
MRMRFHIFIFVMLAAGLAEAGRKHRKAKVIPPFDPEVFRNDIISTHRQFRDGEPAKEMAEMVG